MARKLQVVREPEQRTLDLRVAVADAIKSMPWLGDSDKALRDLAAKYADEIERATDTAEELERTWEHAGGDMDILRRLGRLEAKANVVEVVAKLGPQLLNVLRELGGTPKSRGELGADKPVGGRLAQLRQAAGKHTP
jgi:hypothetical protein